LRINKRLLSESELLYDWRFTANHFVSAINPLRLTTSNFIFQLNTCFHSPYVTSSLTRGWARWSSAAQSFSGQSPAGLMTTFYCLRFEILPQPGGPGPHIHVPQEEGGPLIPSGTGLILPTFLPQCIKDLIRHGPHRNHRIQHFYCCMYIRWRENIEPLSSNCRFFWICYSSL
jgi:hypothetical protein